MATRLMSKVFDVKIERDDEGKVKGSPLQSKINAFTKGKAITRVHDLAVSGNGDQASAFLTYEVDESDNASADRLYAKVLQDVPVGSELQTKVNSFTKGKDYEYSIVRTSIQGDKATVVVLHTKPGADEGSDGDSSES